MTVERPGICLRRCSIDITAVSGLCYSPPLQAPLTNGQIPIPLLRNPTHNPPQTHLPPYRQTDHINPRQHDPSAAASACSTKRTILLYAYASHSRRALTQKLADHMDSRPSVSPLSRIVILRFRHVAAPSISGNDNWSKLHLPARLRRAVVTRHGECNSSFSGSGIRRSKSAVNISAPVRHRHHRQFLFPGNSSVIRAANSSVARLDRCRVKQDFLDIFVHVLLGA